MTTVTIEYCVPCGHLERAVETQAALLQEFGQDLEAVRLVPGDGGVFTIHADGDCLWDKADAESAFDMEDVAVAVRDRIEATA